MQNPGNSRLRGPRLNETSRERMLEAAHKAVVTFASCLCTHMRERRKACHLCPQKPPGTSLAGLRTNTASLLWGSWEHCPHTQNKSDFCKWLRVHWFIWWVLPRKTNAWTQKKKLGDLMTKESKWKWPAGTKAAEGESHDSLNVGHWLSGPRVPTSHTAYESFVYKSMAILLWNPNLQCFSKSLNWQHPAHTPPDIVQVTGIIHPCIILVWTI